jgi:hypothetical protein
VRGRNGVAGLTALLVLAAFGTFAAPAAATFHEIMIREIYPGSGGQTDAEYIELQMWSAGQNLVSGHSISVFNAAGMPLSPATFANTAANGANQSTLVAATPAAESAFGIIADVGLTPGQLDPTGGAVCWESFDCAAWGNFSGSLSSPAGPPAAPLGIPDGMALRRTIAPGCATLLEEPDDTNNSAADFADAFPNPRPNSVPPAEHACSSTQGSGSGGGGAPQTSFRRKPTKRTHDRTPTFRFSSNEAGSSFECKLDRRPFVVCRSPFTVTKLSFRKHTFKVRARDKAGNVDPSPASYKFKVVKRPSR